MKNYDFQSFWKKKIQKYLKIFENDPLRLIETIDLTNIIDIVNKVEENVKGIWKENVDRSCQKFKINRKYNEFKENIELIPFKIRDNIKKTLLKLGVKYNRLKVSEIAENCDEPEDCIILVAQKMIKDGGINADYFKSTNTFAFDLRANLDEINDLMKKFEEWEKEYCQNCGNKIVDRKQQICEYCGKDI